MNRAKPTTLRRPSAAKPSGHPPTGDFIALGSKNQSGDPKPPAVLLKPASTSSTADRKRETSSALPSAGLSGLTKRPKLSTTPPVSALGRLADVAAVDKRAISPSIKEPSVVPIEVSPSLLLDEIEAAESEGNDDHIEGLLCGAVKQLKSNRAKPDITLYLSLMFLAKIKPNVFATEGIIEALCSLLRRDASINFKAKGNSLVSVLASNLLMAAYEEDENWPEIFVKVYIEDSLGERIWVDSSHCKTFVDNIQTAFGTKMPPKSMLLQADTGRSAGDLSAGSSPHPSTPDEDDCQTELLIAEEKLSPEDEGLIMPRYEELSESVEDYVLEVLKDQLNRRQPMDNVSRNLLRLLTATCGYKEARLMAVQRLEMWLQNPKLTRPAQDLLMSLCMNSITQGADDMEVISNLIKIRLKPKVLLNHYMLCVRELLNANRDNLATMVKLVIFNELSNARNPNNMQVLHTVLQHSPEQAPKFLALVFQDLLTNKDDYLRASRALLREIIKQTKHEINFGAFCFGLMQERKETIYLELEFKERFVIQVTDLLTVSMMLGITAQVKESGLAWDKGEKKNILSPPASSSSSSSATGGCATESDVQLDFCPLVHDLAFIYACLLLDGLFSSPLQVAYLPTSGPPSREVSLAVMAEGSGLKRKMRSKRGTVGATKQCFLKPQPVHGTAHSVVVGELLAGTCVLGPVHHIFNLELVGHKVDAQQAGVAVGRVEGLEAVAQVLLHGQAGQTTAQLDVLVHRLVILLADIGDSKSVEGRVSDANLACRKLAVSHPVLLLRHLPMIASLLQGRIHLNFQEFRQQNHMTFFSNVLAILELLQPLVFHSEHQMALQDCLLSFMKVLRNFQRTRSPFVFITKFLQFTQKYITRDASSAIPYLQKHSDILQVLCAENPELVQLKSLLAGLTLPVRRSSSEVYPEEGEDDVSTGSLPLVSISASVSLSAADMTMYLKKMSRGGAVEDVLEVLTEVDEKSRRSPEIIQYFINDLQRLMTSSEDLCRNLAFSLALRCIQNNPCLATDFLPTFMYCMGSGKFDVVQTALRNLPEYVLLCQEHADILLHKAFLVGIYGQIDTSSMIAESMKVLHMESTT
ncbi:integrator complex subunit 1-like [Notothenia coriiceps]|uniref:Integrator complex subunit 1-like n=1 Tax=Notothenia coriiceps TaxID=8208 RepID=A0A6I9NXB9_9TELE|nr:PREDICTED: integrator complex subunit 1-like [Notothenia coriiceps]